MNFGDRVRYVRKKFALTTEQLAQLLNVTQSYISHVENNRRQFGRDKIILLAKKLHIPVEFFLSEDVEILEQIKINNKLTPILFGDESFPDYCEVVNHAVKAKISPAELEQAIEFIKRHKIQDN